MKVPEAESALICQVRIGEFGLQVFFKTNQAEPCKSVVGRLLRGHQVVHEILGSSAQQVVDQSIAFCGVQGVPKTANPS